MYLNTLAQNYNVNHQAICVHGNIQIWQMQRNCLLVHSSSQTAFRHLSLVKRVFQKLKFHCFPSKNANCRIASFLAALACEDLTECLSPSDFLRPALPTCQYPILQFLLSLASPSWVFLLSCTLSAPWCYHTAFFKTQLNTVWYSIGAKQH